MNRSGSGDRGQFDTVIVGGGLAGLTAAALLARAGKSVVVAEQTKQIGGRAATNQRSGVSFNLGPRALYCQGEAFRILTELHVPFSGRFPNGGTAEMVLADRTYPLPITFKALVTSRLLSLREKWRLARLFQTLPGTDTRSLHFTPLADWIEQTAGRGALALLLKGFFRVATYCTDFEQISAGAAIDQLKVALVGNVWYLDGGWQTLVDGLRNVAAGQGASIVDRSKVVALDDSEQGIIARLSDGTQLLGRTAIVAADPQTAGDLLRLPSDASLPRWIANHQPVRAACLDVALRKLARPENRFATGLDRPFYFSVHSAAARLGPENIAVIHVMKYLTTDSTTSGDALEQELETFLSQVQPGWQSHLLDRRLLPNMIVANALPRADQGGLQGRPLVMIPERPNVFLAGDWVGQHGMLADASAASAEVAARQVLAALGKPRAQHSRRVMNVGS